MDRSRRNWNRSRHHFVGCGERTARKRLAMVHEEFRNSQSDGFDRLAEISQGSAPKTGAITEGSVKNKGFPVHGYFGVAVIVAAEALLFRCNQLVGHWFTPIVWTGYILLVDALVYKLKRRSLLVIDRLEFLVVAIISIASWWLFEFYNAPRFWDSNLVLWWPDQNLEPNLWVRRIGYDWAFATITPALLETADLFRATVFKRERKASPIRLGRFFFFVMILIGAAGVVI